MFITKFRDNKIIMRSSIASATIWLVCGILLLTHLAERELMIAFSMVLQCSLLFFTFSFYKLIPKVLKKKRPLLKYLNTSFLIMLVAALPLYFLNSLYLNDEDHAFIFTLLNVMLQLFIIAPAAWYFYKRDNKHTEELLTLQKELGQSAAGLDFLRSQINPHFLFNALNTIYGTAIQEQAERTSEAVQKLGDMMRFMMHENMQEKISLSKEIDYLNNYIDLQKLRTDSNPMLKLETEIEQRATHVSIAPMLLIPFVENAFKHGISMREPSYIKVSLEMREKTLYFDVYNSKHAKQEGDPERGKNGIGLNNVKQRLQLLYRNKHELIIRETGKEFFVHLTITLS